MVQTEREERLSEEPETVTFLAYSACRSWMAARRNALLWEADGRSISSTSPALPPAAPEALSSWQMKTRAHDLGKSILNVKQMEGGVHLGSQTWRIRNCSW